MEPSAPQEWKPLLTDPAQALREREAFVQYLRAHGGRDDDYDTAELIFDELVSNVCFHAEGPIEVRVDWTAGHAVLHVTDEGPPFDMSAISFPDPYEAHGRGLAIVNALSPGVRNITYAGQGKTLSAALPVQLR